MAKNVTSLEEIVKNVERKNVHNSLLIIISFKIIPTQTLNIE